MPAEKTSIAGSRVQRHHPVALPKSSHPGPHVGDHSSNFMSKRDRRLQHHGMVSPTVDLQVSPAGQRRSHANDKLSRARLRHSHALQAKVLFAVQYRRVHLSYHLLYLLIQHHSNAPPPTRESLKKQQSPRCASSSDNLSQLTKCPLSLQRVSPNKLLPPSRTIPSCPGALWPICFHARGTGPISTPRWTTSALVPCLSSFSPASSRGACWPCSRRPRSRSLAPSASRATSSPYPWSRSLARYSRASWSRAGTPPAWPPSLAP